MPQVKLLQPTPNELLSPGQPVSVAGQALDKGMPEPVMIDSVTITVDGGVPISAQLKTIPHQPQTTVSFNTVVQLPQVLGPHAISVTATNDQGISTTATVTVGIARAAQQPQRILDIKYGNPDQPKDVDALYAQAIALGQPNPTAIIGGTFPSDDAKQEWKQVLPPDLTDTAAHEEDYEGFNLVGATGWLLKPEYSGGDVPFDHPFGFDWEFMMALDQPADNPKKYTFLLTPADQSCEEEGVDEALAQADELKDAHGNPIPIPNGPDGVPSLLGVEIDGGLVPEQFTDAFRGGVLEGDRIAVYGRWIVDCGHQVKITKCADPQNIDLHPGVTAFRTEIHPPLLMAAARVTNGSILTGSEQGAEVTRALFVSRPYLVSQRFTTDTGNAYDDNAPDDGPFWTHFIKEVIKVNETIGPIPLASTQVEAHPKIKSKPWRGDYLASFIVRTPGGHSPIGGGPLAGKLTVSYQFTVRSGIGVQVISTEPDSVEVLIAMNDHAYNPPHLPPRHDHTWHRDELEQLNSTAASTYLDVEVVSAAAHLALGGDFIAAGTVAAIFERGILTDDYETDAMRNANLFDASQAVTAFVDNIPAGKGIVVNDNQPFPVMGWLELKVTPPVVVNR